MLVRFCLYGFFKNQQYFDPFLILVFLSKGLTFFEIGLLVATREITVNLLEVPSGAFADVVGRRRSMIASFVAYILSFVVLGLAQDVFLLVPGMLLFGVGDAFRTGTHKAMIFSWLRSQGREDERTRIYGLTRSWSKLGSAISTVLAAGLVVWTNSYELLFFFAIVPYLAGLVNFLGYPKFLDGNSDPSGNRLGVWAHLGQTLRQVVGRRQLRRLVAESMGFEGVFKAAKDYLQPLLQAVVLSGLARSLAVGELGERQQTALLIGPVYFGLYLLSAGASRHAHRIGKLLGGEERAARCLWAGSALLFCGLVPALWFDLRALAILGFVVLFMLQNAWRPVLISRFDAAGDERQAATLLSVENQAKSLATKLLAPLMGLGVDLARGAGLGGTDGFWPVAAIGAVVGLGFFLVRPAAQSGSDSEAHRPSS
jgi:MFS family permease